MLDEMDVKILRILQEDCTRSVADVGVRSKRGQRHRAGSAPLSAPLWVLLHASHVSLGATP